MRSILFVMALVLFAAGPARAEAERLITVTGSGQVEAKPDMARLSVGVTTEAKTASQAMADNSQRMAAVLQRLRDSGIAARDMQTRQLAVSPRMDRSGANRGEPPTISGYGASNSLNVRIRDLAALGRILDDVLDSGANQFNGLTFGLSEPTPHLDEARRLAVADARRKAELYATAAGVTLGQVISVSEPGSAGPQPVARFEAMAAARDGVPLAEGEVVTSASVVMIFAIDGP